MKASVCQSNKWPEKADKQRPLSSTMGNNLFEKKKKRIKGYT